MEVPFESFSIREYTARMRRADASKCWPFDGNGREERQLPPMECRSYRWWSSELQIVRSGGKCEHACGALSCSDAAGVSGADEAAGAEAPVRVTDGEPVVQRGVLGLLPAAQASIMKEDEDGEEEGTQLARSPGKAKVRAPKKRSIVELFAVAPQIEALEDEAEGDDDGRVLAVGKPSEENPRHDEPDKYAVEEPRKRREESVEMLLRKKKEKTKKNCAKKNKENEEKTKKKTKMTMMSKKQHKLLKKQKKQKAGIKIGITKKEKICKLSLQSPVDFARILRDSVIMKRFGKEIKVPVYTQRRKPAKSKSAQKQNKVKAVQTSKLKRQNSEPKIFPVHSILKNQKTISSPRPGRVHTTDGSQNGDGHCAQQSEKHVRFSGKDDILGHGKKHCSPLGSPQMQSLCKVFSDVLTASSVLDKSPEGGKLSESNIRAQVGMENDDIDSACVVNGKTREPLLSEQLADIHEMTNAATSPNPLSNNAKEKVALNDYVDLNNSVQVHNNLNQVDPCPIEPLLKNMNSSQPEVCDHRVVDDTGKETIITDAGRSLPSGSTAVITLAKIVRNSNSELATSSSSADMVAHKGQFYPVVKHHKDVYTYDSQFQSSCLLKGDTISTTYSTGSVKQFHMDDFPESRLKANPVDVFHDKHTSGSLIGLPLNSQGEYIHLQASTQFGFDQLFKKQNMALGPVGSFLAPNSINSSSVDHVSLKGKFPQSSVYTENQKKWVPEKSYTEDQSIVLPASGFTELQDASQTEVRNQKPLTKYAPVVSSLNVEANLFRVPCHGFREQKHFHSHNDRAMGEPEGASEPGFQSITQPTMRLMGKNFIIGRCNNNNEHQGSGDSKIWADKKMIADLGPGVRMSEEPTPKQLPQPEWINHPTSCTSYENLMHTLEAQKKPTSSNFYHLRVDPLSDNAHFDHGRGILSGNSRHSVSLSHGYIQEPFNHPHAHEACLSKAPMTIKNCRSGSELVKIGFQAPWAVCNPENVCQHLLLNSTHCKHSQSLSHNMTSTFHPSSAFQNPDNGKYVQLPLGQCSSQSLPHWLLNAGRHGKTTNSSALSFSDSIPKHDPRTKSGTSIFPLPSPSVASIMSFPSLGQNSHVCFSDLPTSASLVHSSLISSFPAAKSTCASNTCYWTMCNDRDDMKSKYSFLKSSDFANKSRKRPAQGGSNFLKPVKRPSLSTQGVSRAPMGPKKGEQLHACTEHISKMLELRSYGDKEVKVNNVVKDAHSNVHTPSTSKLDTGSRSRPVKLSAGAKHILKPSLNMDQDNSMPTHSTIPFAHGTSSGKVPVSQKKPAKIYQF